MQSFNILRKILFLFCFCWVCNVRADVFPECEINNLDNIFIESIRGCRWYIFCNGDDSFEAQCEEGFYFNLLEQTCDPKDDVKCRLDLTTTTMTTRATTTSTIRPTITWPSTGSSTPTDALSTMTPTTTTTANCQNIVSPYQLIFVRHPTSCADYFICYHGQEIQMHCSAMLHFNEHTAKCDYPENVHCQADLALAREQCQSHRTDFFPHPDNCNFYYYCKKGFLMVQHCPIFQNWDYERRVCAPQSLAKCYHRQQTSRVL